MDVRIKIYYLTLQTNKVYKGKSRYFQVLIYRVKSKRVKQLTSLRVSDISSAPIFNLYFCFAYNFAGEIKI